MTDHYATLGVPRDADTAAIRNAYRTAAKTEHPDAGGDSERWHAVQVAHDVLTDDGRRARYDRTGDTAAPAPDTKFSRAVVLLSAVLDELLGRMAKNGQSIERCDVVAQMGVVMAEWRKGAMQTLAELVTAEAVHREMAKRFTSTTGDNLMRTLVESRLDGIAAKRATIKANIELGDFAVGLLKTARYRVDVEQAYQGAFGMLGLMQQGAGVRG